MSTNAPDANESIEPRTERALTEYMSVLPEGGEIYTVVGQNGGTYTVDGREGRCTCPDAEYREATCKHQRRVAFATGERPIPAAVDGVDEQLGEHTEAAPHVVASDGGIIEAGDDGEVLEDDERPDDCSCTGSRLEAEGGLPCWPCYRDGFDEPNPNAPGGEDDEEAEDDTPRRSEPADFGYGDSTGVQDL